jgi:hypothetical protein
MRPFHEMVGKMETWGRRYNHAGESVLRRSRRHSNQAVKLLDGIEFRARKLRAAR